jgi:hypothetical protein
VCRLGEGFLELASGEDLCPPVVIDPDRRLACQLERVVDPCQRALEVRGAVDELAAGVGQREKVAGQVAAVD